MISIINSAGAGSYTDTFVYTAALSTVAPTGNVTVSPTGAAASANNLIPDPKNLQVSLSCRSGGFLALGSMGKGWCVEDEGGLCAR